MNVVFKKYDINVTGSGRNTRSGTRRSVMPVAQTATLNSSNKALQRLKNVFIIHIHFSNSNRPLSSSCNRNKPCDIPWLHRGTWPYESCASWRLPSPRDSAHGTAHNHPRPHPIITPPNIDLVYHHLPGFVQFYGPEAPLGCTFNPYRAGPPDFTSILGWSGYSRIVFVPL